MKTLMIQGTASNAGKSVLTAGLCRVARRRGIRVTPFKSQNMSLNAAVTSNGLEIGRAQALQAFAAGLEPNVAMNPILLKPEGEMRSQIVLRGRAVARADFHGYAEYREQCIAAIDESLAQLATSTDLLIAEGAGSPAEINLMERDIANMFVARRTDAEVVLVGDIDRGGVFASLVGTMALLPPEDGARVSGFLINRFRGDVSLLEPGLVMLEERSGRPTFGVIPFLNDLGLPEEDGESVVVQNGSFGSGEGRLNVAVVRLPRLSNHDDFLPLENDDRVELHYVNDPRGLAGADLVILPGSKASRSDLAWLRARGFESALHGHLRRDGRILGICGGYQMLGARIVDEHGTEGDPGESQGLGLLPVETIFEETKAVRPVALRVEHGAHWLTQERTGSADEIVGYEIHCGRVRVLDEEAAPTLFRHGDDGQEPGAPEGCATGAVAGTLVHGLFENECVLSALLGARGSATPWRVELDQAMDRLADVLEESIEPSALARWFG